MSKLSAKTLGELRRFVNESSKNEFKPVVFGSDESKRTNEKAYSDIAKETKAYDGGLTNKSEKASGGGIGATDNMGQHDLRFDNINSPYIDKVEAQMKGYPSKDAMDKHKNEQLGNASYDNDGKIYNDAKKHAELAKQGKDAATEIGLTRKGTEQEGCRRQ